MATSQGEAKRMVSYGGKIDRSGSGEARYVGGENQLVGDSRSASLRCFRARLASRAGFSDSNFSVKYGISGESLDALRDVASEADLLDKVLYRDLQIRLFRDKETPRRVRVFLFRVDATAVPSPVPASQALPAIMRPSPTSPDFFSAEQNKKPTQPSADHAKAISPPPVRQVATSPASLADMAPPSGTPAPASSGLLPRPPKRQIASAPSLSAPRKDYTPASSSSTASTTSAVAGTSISSTTQDSGRNAQVVHRLAEQTRPSPVFLLPVAPIIVYQLAIILVPAFSCNVVLGLC